LQKKEDPDTSHSSANSSFPISESALPTTFDTSADHLPPAELSHFFPRPPTTVDTSGSQESFTTASDCVRTISSCFFYIDTYTHLAAIEPIAAPIPNGMLFFPVRSSINL
jgi:hypothetical protein